MEKIFKEDFVLSNGVAIPLVGYGTWQVQDEKVLDTLIPLCMELGLHHIDTAWDYKNETIIGAVIKKHQIPRDQFFITSKLPSHIKGFDITLEYFAKTLKDLQLEYLDLYLIHAPWPWSEIGKDCSQGNVDSFKAMIQLYKEGKIRAIGVSNFSIADLQNIIKHTGFVPHVNQIPFFISHFDRELIKFCQDNGILVEAYSPFGTGRILDNGEIRAMANKYKVSVPQLCLRYCIEHEALPLFKTNHSEYLRSNIELDFAITPKDMEILDNIKREEK